MSWKPILEGALARSARDAVRAIAGDLMASPPDVTGPSFSSGHAGLALFFGYLSRWEGEDRFAEIAGARLEQAVDMLSEASFQSGFFAGLSGVAWVNHHLCELLEGEATPDLNEEVDDLLLELTGSTPWRRQYDLIHGLAGIGCYALDHPDRSVSAALLRNVVERLAETAEEQEEGRLSWRTAPAFIYRAAERFPRGLYDAGVAHGVPGVIGMLARASAAGLGGGETRRLLEGAVAWLLANRRAGEEGSVFPGRFEESGANAGSCRSAWCYGDPGVSAALLLAARASGEPAWEQEALSIARRDCLRPADKTGVVDAELCHGAVGLGHLYNRFYQATGDEMFLEAARGWFERALAMRRPEDEAGGFLNLWPEDQTWHAESGLLVGSAGIGLALLAALSPVEPGWDRPMLLSLPSRTS